MIDSFLVFGWCALGQRGHDCAHKQGGCWAYACGQV